MTDVLMTEWFRFLGMNIKGTPAMSAEDVAHDLEVAKTKCSVLVVQEFRWRWYWITLRTIVGIGKWGQRWRTSPGMVDGAARPVRGAQAVMWRNRRWKKVRSKVALLHHGAAAISEDRFIRATLLQERATGLHCWFLTTHFVVGGDMALDPIRRRNLMAIDIKALGAFLDKLVATGHPIIGQLDANLRPRSTSYAPFMKVFRRYGARFHGDHGVEYLFTIDGRTVNVGVKEAWVVPTTELKTDHEGRGITVRLVARSVA